MPRPRSSPLFPYTTLFRSVIGFRLHALETSVPENIKADVRSLAEWLRERQRSLRELVASLATSERSIESRLLPPSIDRKSTRLNSSHRCISYAVFCLKKKK